MSSYVARDGQVVTATCSGLRVRPTGTNVTYPPTQETFDNPPDGFRIDINIPGEDDVFLNVTNTRVITSIPNSTWRWIGSVLGGSVNDNSTRWEGIALYEALSFSL